MPGRMAKYPTTAWNALTSATGTGPDSPLEKLDAEPPVVDDLVDGSTKLR